MERDGKDGGAGLDVKVASRAGTLTLALAGEIDLDSVTLLHQAIHEAQVSWGTHVTIDLSGVTFMDSSGVHALLTQYQQAQDQGGSLSVTGAQGVVERVLHLSGVMSLLQPRPSGNTRPGLN